MHFHNTFYKLWGNIVLVLIKNNFNCNKICISSVFNLQNVQESRFDFLGTIIGTTTKITSDNIRNERHTEEVQNEMHLF